MSLKTAREIWNYLKEEYAGDDQIRNMQVLNLIREFELQRMKESETIKEYSDKLLAIVNKVRLLGIEFADSRIVQKILVTVPEKYESTITTLENTKDLSNITLAEVLHALKAQEQRRLIRQEGSMPDARCHRCGQLGHIERICKSQQQQEEVKVAEDLSQEEQLFAVSCYATHSSTESWLIDSGCTNHMTYDRELFRELDEAVFSKVKIGNGAYIEVKGRGTVAIEGHTGLKLISEVLYVPEINQNLLSVPQLLEKGYKVLFEDKNCMIKDSEGREVFNVQMKGKSFALDFMSKQQEVNSTTLWHKRLGHSHHNALMYLKKNNLAKNSIELEEELLACDVCQYGKQTRLPFPKELAWRATERLQLIHTDVGGPMRTPSLNESKYYIVFIDDNTRMCWIYFMKFKSDVAHIFWKLKAWIETQKRKNRTIMEMARCLLHEKELPKKFWAEAANTAVFLLNRLPTKALQKKTSFEAWYGYKPELLNLNIFGCLCYSYIPKVKRDKLDKKAEPGIFVGYSLISKAYRIYIPHNDKVIVSRDVKFLDLDSWNWKDDKNIEFQEENEAIDDEPVRGTRSLSDIYQRCNVEIMEPAGYAEAANDKKWIDAMEEELKMIEKTRLGNWWTDLIIRKLLEELIDKFKERMKDAFEMTDLGNMSFFLGMQVQQRQNEIFVCQQKYAKEVLKKFNMGDCKPVATPMNQKEKFSKEDGAERVDENLYRSLIGCLMYLTATGTDIMYVVSLLSRYTHCASEIHFQAAKRILRYVKGTVDYGIRFNQVQNFRLLGYSDSDWAGCVDDMRSTSGYCFTLGSGVFSWCSKKQEVIAQSTAEAEYIAAVAAVNQTLWIR
ncbi:unnamed protein product [Trifolium pratense]|uniref:Uncharacterized protein n=1 Tax=Trifolium pratense TaxID=57577 RepID=A0ACB0IWS8_TRIPR|nr:unnamed protein product [Trifolium pratense]